MLQVSYNGRIVKRRVQQPDGRLKLFFRDQSEPRAVVVTQREWQLKGREEFVAK